MKAAKDTALLLAGLAACAIAGSPWIILAGCGPITPAGAIAAEAGLAAACGALSFVPVIGGVLAAACSGEEATLKAALDAAIAKQAAAADGGKAGLALPVGGAVGAVYATRAGRRVHVGYVPASLARDVQVELDRR